VKELFTFFDTVSIKHLQVHRPIKNLKQKYSKYQKMIQNQPKLNVSNEVIVTNSSYNTHDIKQILCYQVYYEYV